MIEAKSVSKQFGQFSALSEITFKLNKGEVVGFLGRNGAGKTTLMRILTTFLSPSTGEVIVGGISNKKDSLALRRKIGYLPEHLPLYNNMSVKDYLTFAAQIKDINPKEIAQAVDRATRECQLTEVLNKSISLLSKGYKQRIGIAQAIIHKPEVLILDEPTNGLDPIQIKKVRELIKNLQQQTTIIISTHILTEVSQLSQRLLILKKGRIIVDGPLDEVVQQREDSQTLEELFFNLHKTDE